MSQLGLKYKFKPLVDIKRDEVGQTFLMFAYNFLIFGSHTIVKSVQKASFIHGAGAARLPYVYIGIAVVAGVYPAFRAATGRAIQALHRE